MKAQLREANKMRANYAIIIGENELEKRQIELKDLTTGDQQKVAIGSILSHLKSLSF